MEKIESARKFHTEVLKPARWSINIPVQNYLPGIYPNGSERKTAQGRFYEFLTAGMYGGRLCDIKFKIDSNTYLGSVKPDVIDEENKIIWESKGFAIYYSCNIMNRQILGNMNLQLGSPNYQFNYALYQHPIKGMNSTYQESIDTLIKDLSEKTLFSVVLPLEVILHLSIPGNDNGAKAVRHYEGEKEYPNCICLNRSFTKRLFFNPEESMESIGLLPDDYSFKKYVSPSMEVNKNKINPFPIVFVSRKNGLEWVNNFSQDKNTQKELAKHLKPFRKKEAN